MVKGTGNERTILKVEETAEISLTGKGRNLFQEILNNFDHLLKHVLEKFLE